MKKIVSTFLIAILLAGIFDTLFINDMKVQAADGNWSSNITLGQNGSYSFAGIYEYDNLTIGNNVLVTSSGISQLVIKVNGTLTIGDNVKIVVRNGYYSGTPITNVANLAQSSLTSYAVYNGEGYSLYANLFGSGGNGGSGGAGGSGTTNYASEYCGSGGSGGGGGAGGFGGGLAGSAGSRGFGARYPGYTSGNDGYAGQVGNNNGGNGGYGGANTYNGIGGGATGVGTDASVGGYGSGGSGGGGNGGSGSNGEQGYPYFSPFSAGGGGGGGGGGYGGGILTIVADKIIYNSSAAPKFLVSGQVGGYGGAGSIKADSGYSGGNGQGGILIINSNDYNTSTTHYNLSTPLAVNGGGGHGTIIGNPSQVFFNINTLAKPIELKSSVPTNNETNVVINSSVQVDFNTRLLQGSNFNTISLINTANAQAVLGSASIIGSTLIFTPNSSLSYATQYKLNIPAASLNNAMGVPIAKTVEIIFSTVVVELTKSVPANNAENITVDSTITATFNTNIKEGSLYSNIALIDTTTGNSVAISTGIIGNMLLVIPSNNLNYLKNYKLSIPVSSLNNSNGIASGKLIEISFTTVASPLKYVNSIPDNNAINILTTSKISITFNTDIKQGDKFYTIVLTNTSSGQSISGTTTINGSTLTFSPTNALEYSKTYKLTIPISAINNTSDAPNTSQVDISFKTCEAPLELVSSTPTDGAVNTEVNLPMTVLFNGGLVQGPAFSDIKLLNISSGQFVAGTVTLNGSVLSFSPNSDLSNSNLFKLIIPASALNNLSNIPLESMLEIKFATLPYKNKAVLWKSNFGGSDHDGYNSIVSTTDGYIAVGYASATSFGSGDWIGFSGKGKIDAVIVKYDTNDNVVWKNNFGGSDDDYFRSVTATTDGYIAVGYSLANSFGNGDWSSVARKGYGETATIVKFDINGNVVWKKNFGANPTYTYESLFSRFHSVVSTSDGFVVVGYSTAFGSGDWSGVTGQLNHDATIVKFNNSGNVVWKKAIGGGGSDYYYSATATADGVVVAGASGGFGGTWSGFTGVGAAVIVKYDTSGNVVWKKHFGGEFDEFQSLALTTDGYIAVGYSPTAAFGNGDWIGISGKGLYDAIIVKYDLMGNIIWKKNFGGSDYDYFKSITITNDGYIAVGYSYFGSFGNGDWTGIAGKGMGDGIIVKYDTFGNVVWKKNFGVSSYDYYSSVIITNDEYIVAGSSYLSSFNTGDWSNVSGKGGADAIIVKYSDYFTSQGSDNLISGFYPPTKTSDGFIFLSYFENKTSSTITAKAIYALYDVNNKLIAFTVQDIDINPDQILTPQVDIKTQQTAYKIKAFVLNNFDNIQPITDSVEMYLNP